VLDGAREVLVYRVVVETGAVVLAAERVSRTDLERLEALTERMDEAIEFEDYRRADVRFHIGVSEATGSPRIVAAMTEVQGQMSNLIARIAHPRAVLRNSNEQHRRLIAHLRHRDAGAAVRVAREHTEGTEHILAGLLPK
jgi:GntR family transcriptional repressor for pyruvate dehydrogenase complex